MSQATVPAIEHAIHVTHRWLHDLMRELEEENLERAYRTLRAVLHALRDRLPVQEAADLAAQLPLILRGVYFDGWSPADKPEKTNREEFLADVSRELATQADWETEHKVKTVFRFLKHHISEGEIGDVIAVLPEDLKRLWPIHSIPGAF